MYQIKGYIAFSEEDNFDDGCFGPTKSHYVPEAEFNIQHETVDGLIGLLMKEFKATPDCVMLDSCDEPGRIDIQAVQSGPFVVRRISEKTRQAFVERKRNLWLTDYIFQVVRVEENFSLKPLVDHRINYASE